MAMAAGADQALDISLHDDLKHGLRDGSKEVVVAALREQLGYG